MQFQLFANYQCSITITYASFRETYQKNTSYLLPLVPTARLIRILNRIIFLLFIVDGYYSVLIIDLISL